MSKQSSQRLPAPSLFVGPPSHNASNVSLTRANTDTSQQTSRNVPSSAIPNPSSPSLNSSSLSRSNTAASRQQNANPLSRQNTNLSRRDTQRDGALSRQNTNLSQQLPRPDGLQVPDDNGTAGEKTGGVGLANTTIDEEVKRQRPRRGTAVLDAHWAALQSTLSDIELSAGSSAHVFGTGHAKALEELRAAQVELARAWGQTDSEDTSTLPTKEVKPPDTTTAQRNSKDNSNTKDKEDKHQSNKEQEKQAEQNERKLSTATTLDLTSAARRREASDKYFAAVKEGVAEVVRKLDGVADAMREVEMQSRDIWGDDGKDSSEMTDSEFGSLSS